MNNDDRIELRHLRYFVVLSDELHFARAAERLGIEQSPLSRAIRELEALLGVQLFERTTRSTRITRGGNVLLEYAQKILQTVGQGQAAVRSAALGYSSRLRIAISDCAAYSGIMNAIGRFHVEHPDLCLSLSELSLSDQIKALRDDAIDASVTMSEDEFDGISKVTLGHEELFAVVSAADAKFTDQKNLDVSDLSGERLVLFDAGSDLGGGDLMESFARSLKRPSSIQRAGSIAMMVAMVRLGRGVAFAGSSQMGDPHLRNIHLLPIRGGGPKLTMNVFYPAGGMSGPLSHFIRCAKVDAFSGPSNRDSS